MIDENYHYDYQFNYIILYETIYLIQESLEFQEELELPMYDNYEYFTDFQNLIVSSYNSMNQELLDFLSNEEKQYELENYSYLLMEYVLYYSWIGEFEQIVQDSENILLLEQDRESIENSLAVLVEYIFRMLDYNVRKSFLSNLTNFFELGKFSNKAKETSEPINTNSAELNLINMFSMLGVVITASPNHVGSSMSMRIFQIKFKEHQFVIINE